MRTSVGFWDALFGERVTMEIPMSDGAIKKVEVTRKWLAYTEREGKFVKVSQPNPEEVADPLMELADSLVQASRLNAAGMFCSITGRFPVLADVDTEQWDFVLTVAGIFMAATRLNNLSLGDDREEHLMDVVSDRLDQWNPDGRRGFDDCKDLFETEFDRLSRGGHEPQFLASDAVGTWIVLNVFGHGPQADVEWELVRATGALVTHAFFDYWDEERPSDV